MGKPMKKKVVKQNDKPESAAKPDVSEKIVTKNAVSSDFEVTKSVRSKVKEATKALKLYLDKKAAADGENMLFGDESSMVVQFSLSKIPERERQRPVMIELPHPLFDKTESSVCVFVKDDKEDKTKKNHQVKRKLWKNLVVDGAQKEGLTHVKKVISLEKLKKEFKQYEAKRNLAEQHDCFLCDKSIIEVMPACLGKVFMKQYKSKWPAPVKITKEDPVSDIKRVLNCTPLRIPSGPCVGVRVGKTSKLSEEALTENILAVLNEAKSHLADTGIKSVHVTATSCGIALPVFEQAVQSSREVRATLKGATWKERNPEKETEKADKVEKEESSEEEAEKPKAAEKKKGTLPLLKKKKKKVVAVKK